MKILKNRLHVVFKDLHVGETYLCRDNLPHMKIAASAACKVEGPPFNTVCLSSGVCFKEPPEKKLVKIELGITGMFDMNE